MTIDKQKKNEVMEMIAHLCVGLSILMKGIDKLDHHGKELVGIFFIAAAAGILIGSIFHKKYEQRLGSFKYFIFGTEMIVMALLGYVQMKDGSHLLYYFSFGVSVLFIIPIVKYSINPSLIGSLCDSGSIPLPIRRPWQIPSGFWQSG